MGVEWCVRPQPGFFFSPECFLCLLLFLFLSCRVFDLSFICCLRIVGGRGGVGDLIPSKLQVFWIQFMKSSSDVIISCSASLSEPDWGLDEACASLTVWTDS